MTAITSPAPESPISDRDLLLPCEIYQAWQAAHEDAEDAFRAWCASPFDRKSEGYAVYRAAADRENVAAERWLAV
jgi:hypothetical protein